MLVLTRKAGGGDSSTITVGDGAELVEVTLLEVQGDSVRLGIAAPKETAVHRKEIWQDIQENGLNQGNGQRKERSWHE